MNQGGTIIKIFVFLFLLVCFVADGSHNSTFITHKETQNFRGCGNLLILELSPNTFNHTHIHSVDACFTIVGQHEMCDDGKAKPWVEVKLETDDLDHSSTAKSLERFSPNGYSIFPNGITTEYCYTTYVCQWASASNNLLTNGFHVNGRRKVKVAYDVQANLPYDPEIPVLTPIEFSMRVASLKIKTTGDIYLPDGYRVFDIECELKNCLITADTENGGSGKFEGRRRIKPRDNERLTPECLGDGELGEGEIYLFTFTCHEMCPEKLTVTVD